jgi:hypothetical protein
MKLVVAGRHPLCSWNIRQYVAIMGNDVSISAIATKSPCETTNSLFYSFIFIPSSLYSINISCHQVYSTLFDTINC